jgi:hypothetical protein
MKRPSIIVGGRFFCFLAGELARPKSAIGRRLGTGLIQGKFSGKTLLKQGVYLVTRA